MNYTRLSICMPTYNFGKYIAETLDSIVGQLTDDVEIIVVDGGSTDSTPEIVRQYHDRCPNLKYIRLKQKGGIDLDMAKSVELASGEYCWLFSSDDIMAEGAIARILGEIKDGFDVYLCGFTLCSIDMKPIGKHIIMKTHAEIAFDLANEKVRLNYFRLAENTTALFSFCSSLVINKNRWNSVKVDNSFYGTCWAHAARIFSMIPNGLNVKFLPEPMLYKRTENDSFLDQGLVNRMRISVDGYRRISETFFDVDSEEAFHIRRCVRAEWPLRQIMEMKASRMKRQNDEELFLLNKLAARHYSDPTLSNRIANMIFRWDSLGGYISLCNVLDRIKVTCRPLYRKIRTLQGK